jgi:hypothetical protein
MARKHEPDKVEVALDGRLDGGHRRIHRFHGRHQFLPIGCSRDVMAALVGILTSFSRFLLRVRVCVRVWVRIGFRQRLPPSRQHSEFSGRGSGYFLREVNYLADVMVGVGGHAQEYGEAVVGFWFSHGGIGLGEIFGGLFADGGGDHGDSAVEIDEYLFLGEHARLVEFAVAVTHVAGTGDLRADVVIQIASEMQEQMADAIAVRIGLSPELLGGKGRDPLVKAKANFFVVSGERGSDELAELCHWPVWGRSEACGVCDSKLSFLNIQISTFNPRRWCKSMLRAKSDEKFNGG